MMRNDEIEQVIPKYDNKIRAESIIITQQVSTNAEGDKVACKVSQNYTLNAPTYDGEINDFVIGIYLKFNKDEVQHLGFLRLISPEVLITIFHIYFGSHPL